MKLKINGIGEYMDDNISLAGLVEKKGLKLGRIVVEHNEKILKHDELDKANLKEGDNIEFISFMGGGQRK